MKRKEVEEDLRMKGKRREGRRVGSGNKRERGREKDSGTGEVGRDDQLTFILLYYIIVYDVLTLFFGCFKMFFLSPTVVAILSAIFLNLSTLKLSFSNSISDSETRGIGWDLRLL